MIENTDAAIVSRSKDGSPQAKAHLKRARSELDESCQLELKRLRASNLFFNGEGGSIAIVGILVLCHVGSNVASHEQLRDSCFPKSRVSCCMFMAHEVV